MPGQVQLRDLEHRTVGHGVPEIVSPGSVEGELLQECECQEEVIGRKWAASLE